MISRALNTREIDEFLEEKKLDDVEHSTHPKCKLFSFGLPIF